MLFYRAFSFSCLSPWLVMAGTTRQMPGRIGGGSYSNGERGRSAPESYATLIEISTSCRGEIAI
jgi:hypothetical protein